MTPPRYPKRPILVLTYPRTASNLFMKLLCLPEQDSALSTGSGGYFFFPAAIHLNQAGLLKRPLDNWTDDEISIAKAKYQSCHDGLQKLLASAAEQNKILVNKEHLPFIMSLNAISDFLHNSPCSDVWKVTVPGTQNEKGLPENPSVLPNDFLTTCVPIFLIRHPALAFPSYYRVILSFCEGARDRVESDMVEYIALACTLHWTRGLFDWYTANWSVTNINTPSPILLDSDDIIKQPSLVCNVCDLVGLDSSKVKFTWDPLTNDEKDNLDLDSAKARVTLNNSSSISNDKTFDGLSIEEEAKKWKEEFGRLAGSRIERWVKAAMPDYEYLMSKRFQHDISMAT